VNWPRLTRAIAVVLAGFGVPRGALAVENVTQCGARYSGPGALAGDLDCAGSVFGIVIDANGSLDLRGFHYSGGILCAAEPAAGDGAAEFVARTCKITGPGTISGAVHADSSLTLTNVTVVGSVHSYKRVIVNGCHFADATPSASWPPGWWASGYCISVGSTTAGGNGHPPRSYVNDTILDGCGIGADKLGVQRTTITGAGETGVLTETARLVETTVTASAADGVAGEALKVFDSTIRGNSAAGVFLTGISETRRANLKMKRSIVSNNADGVLGDGADFNLGVLHGKNIVVAGSTITGNARFGLKSDLGAVTAVRSDVRANGTDVTCGISQACADLAGSVSPRVSSPADCDTSYVLDSGIPGVDWEICALD